MYFPWNNDILWILSVSRKFCKKWIRKCLNNKSNTFCYFNHFMQKEQVPGYGSHINISLHLAYCMRDMPKDKQFLTPAKLNSNQNSELIIYQLPRVLLLIKNWGKLCRIHTEYKQKNKRAKPSKTEKKKSTDDLGICGLRKCEDEQERHL